MFSQLHFQMNSLSMDFIHENITKDIWNFFFVSKYQEQCVIFFWLLRIPKDFSKWAKWSVRSVGERSPKRRPGSPLGVAVAEDVAIRSDWSEMERTEKTSEGSAKRQKRSSHFPDMEKHKKKTFQYIQWYPILALIFFLFWRILTQTFQNCIFVSFWRHLKKHSKSIKKPYSTLWIL